MRRPDRRKLEEHAPGLGLVLAIAALSGLVDRFVGPPSDRHAVLLAVLVAGTGLVTWRITQRWDLAALAAAIAGLWALPHATHRRDLWLALVPLGLLAIPGERLERIPHPLQAIVLAGLAAGATAWLSLDPLALVLAGVLAPAFLWIRPHQPTAGTIGAIRTGSLAGPGLALIGLVGLNAGTGWLEQADAATALWIGVGLAGLGALVGLAGLGLSTLLESDDPDQASAWVALAVPVATLVALAPTRSVEILRAVASSGMAPLALLASLTAARLSANWGPRPLGYGVALLATALQVGLF